MIRSDDPIRWSDPMIRSNNPVQLLICPIEEEISWLIVRSGRKFFYPISIYLAVCHLKHGGC